MSSLFRQPDYFRLWFVGLVASVVRWLETLAVGVFVYQTTDSAFLVAMMTMLRLLPMGLFGALLGAMAERLDRRMALIVVVLRMMLTSAVLAVLALSAHLALWHLAVASFLNGLAWATDNRPSHYVRVYVGGVFLYVVVVVLFALVPSPIVAGAALLLTGFGGAGFSIMQATLVYIHAPAEMRGRVLGILSLCIGTGPIGFIGIGLAAEAFGAQAATVASGLIGLAVLVLTRRWWKAI